MRYFHHSILKFAVFGSVVSLFGLGCINKSVNCEIGTYLDVKANECKRAATAIGCGDGKIDSGEECDDGNLANADGCNRRCDLEPTSTIQILD